MRARHEPQKLFATVNRCREDVKVAQRHASGAGYWNATPEERRHLDAVLETARHFLSEAEKAAGVRS